MSDELVKAYRSFNHIFKYLPVDDSLPEILLRVIKLTEKTFHHRQTSILLFDNEKQKFTPFTYKEQHHSRHDRLIINPNKIHFKNICLKNKIIISQHITTNNEYRKYYSLKTINTLNRCYGLPILSSKNKVLGLIYLYSSHNSQITNDEQELLEMAATTCSVSIERNKREQELKHIALHDYLTNIWNRRAFYHHMNKVMKNIQLKNIYLTMFYIDINKFKIINDRYGHQFGDRVLKKYAEKLQTLSLQPLSVHIVFMQEILKIQTLIV